jgi:hypothetical protein
MTSPKHQVPYTDDMHAAAVNAYNDALAWYGPQCTMSALHTAVWAALDAAVDEGLIESRIGAAH